MERDILELGAADGPVQSRATLERWYREFEGRLEDVGVHRSFLPHARPSGLTHCSTSKRCSCAGCLCRVSLAGARACMFMAGRLGASYGYLAMGFTQLWVSE